MAEHRQSQTCTGWNISNLEVEILLDASSGHKRHRIRLVGASAIQGRRIGVDTSRMQFDASRIQHALVGASAISCLNTACQIFCPSLMKISIGAFQEVLIKL
jgi:hypothetical protein